MIRWRFRSPIYRVKRDTLNADAVRFFADGSRPMPVTVNIAGWTDANAKVAAQTVRMEMIRLGKRYGSPFRKPRAPRPLYAKGREPRTA